MDERVHDLSYAEIGTLVKELRAELEMWRRVAGHLHTILDDKAIPFRCECSRPSCQEMRVYFDTTIKESVEVVVEMMNSGEVDPKAVYPRNRYHGD